MEDDWRQYRPISAIPTHTATSGIWQQALVAFGSVQAGYWLLTVDIFLGHKPYDIIDRKHGPELIWDYLNEITATKDLFEIGLKEIEDWDFWPLKDLKTSEF